eukprot:GHVS01108930.1.p1 GENE.GHVS01108930.1~~GHVS01108930.1.p1  ORF type:complete len:156 (+),score=37.95 GHVS01108930.1:315-782(+)
MMSTGGRRGGEFINRRRGGLSTCLQQIGKLINLMVVSECSDGVERLSGDTEVEDNNYTDDAVVSDKTTTCYMGIEVDPVYGGSGMTFTDCLIVIEQIARVDPAVAVVVDIHVRHQTPTTHNSNTHTHTTPTHTHTIAYIRKSKITDTCNRTHTQQ